MKKSTVLCVEDTPHGLVSERRILEYVGFDVISASSSEEVLEKASQFSPDVIVLKSHRLYFDSFNACRCLKTSQRTKEIPVIILDDPNLEEKALEAGADVFLALPADFDEFANVTQAYL